MSLEMEHLEAMNERLQMLTNQVEQLSAGISLMQTKLNALKDQRATLKQKVGDVAVKMALLLDPDVEARQHQGMSPWGLYEQEPPENLF